MVESGALGRIEAQLVKSGATKAARASFAVFVKAAEVARIAGILAAAAPPESCGSEIPVAPAFGAFQVFQPMELLKGGMQRPSGYLGRNALRRADVFDAMVSAPFTSSQVGIARHYRDLTERHAAGGMRCASLEAGRGGGGSGEFIDTYVREGRELEMLHQRIGRGIAMAVRRIRPSARGAAAGIIHDRSLVDMVCLGQLTFSQVLRHFGWSEAKKHRMVLRAALAGSLDRMQGYQSVGAQNVD